MTNGKREFPPPKISDLDLWSASNFLSLIRQALETPVTILLGSGVSASAGLPIWNELLKRICTVFFYHWEWEVTKGKATLYNPPRELSMVFMEDFFWSDEAIALGEEFSKDNPTLVAQQIKNCIRDIDWRYLLYKVLYNEDLEPKESQLMCSLARLCSKSNSIAAIVNYNYDSLFEMYLTENNVKFSVLWDDTAKRKKNTLPIYHPHGYLRFGGGPTSKIMLAESDYHRESAEPYSWANLIQTKALCNSTCVFVGTSMTDPNWRRLLRATIGISHCKHFAFLPRRFSDDPKDQMYRSLFDRDLTKLGVMPIRYTLSSSTPDHHMRLPELIDLLTESIIGGNTL